MDYAALVAALDSLIVYMIVLLLVLVGFLAYSISSRKRKYGYNNIKNRRDAYWKKRYPDNKPQAFYSDRR